VRNFTSALAASISFAPAWMPPENMVVCCTSGGSGPTKSTPSKCASSLTCWKPISTSPFAMMLPTKTLVGVRGHRVGNAQALEQRDDEDAAGAGGIADRFGGQERFLQRLGRTDVGLGRPGAHPDADARFRQIDAAARNDFAGLDVIVHSADRRPYQAKSTGTDSRAPICR
jgi:hypothetical protein